MPRSKREVDRGLLGKGFRPKEGDHSYFVYWTESGKKTVVMTKTSHGNSGQQIGDPLLALMARQTRLSSAQFLALIDCSLDRSTYEALLIEKGLIQGDES